MITISLIQKRIFSRQRKLSRKDCSCLPYKLQERSIQSEIPHLFQDTPEVTPSAVAQSRSKFKSTLYTDVFDTFNEKTRKYDTKKFKDHSLLACDGSGVNVLPGDQKNYAKTKNVGHRYFKNLNCLYDALNHTFLELALEYKGQKVIFTCDRGYESIVTFYKLDQAGIKFVIRTKDQATVNSIIKDYPKPDTDEYDIPYNVILTTKSSTASLIKNRGKYKYINPNKQSIPFPEGVTELPLNLRIVRFWAVCEGNASLITVITNLDPEEFSTEDIKGIYGLRWQEEVGFRTLKGSLSLNSMHSRKEEHIIGEVFAKLTLYNLCSRIRNALEEKKLKKKHIHKLDFEHTINLVWDNLFLKRPMQGIDDLIRKRTQPERPNRADPRKKKKTVK